MQMQRLIACAWLATVSMVCGRYQDQVNPAGPTSGMLIGSGRVITEQRSVGDFTTIVVSSAIEAMVTVGGNESLEITAEDNIAPVVKRCCGRRASIREVATSSPSEFQKPISLEKNFCASSAIGYRNNNRGVSGTTAAIVIVVNNRGPAEIHRIPLTPVKALARSASDWMSAVPSNGASAGARSPVHFASNSVTYCA